MYNTCGIPCKCIVIPCNPTKVISHTFKSRQQDIKDALLVG